MMTETGENSNSHQEQGQSYPNSFAEYVEAHPEILPDYHAFAHEIIDILHSRPDELPSLTANSGIGKSRLLVPALLDEGDRLAYQPLGSVNVDMQYGLSVMFDWHKYKGSSSDIGSNVGGEINHYLLSSLLSMKPGSIVDSRRAQMVQERTNTIGEEAFRNVLHQRFTEGRDGRPGLFVIDDLMLAADEYPWFGSFIGKLARENDVRLIITQPANYGDEKTDEYIEKLRKFGQQLGQTPRHIDITEQLVSIEAIDTLLETYGIDKSEDKAFKAVNRLRRLRVIEAIVDEVFANRDDETLKLNIDEGNIEPDELRELRTIKGFAEYFGVGPTGELPKKYGILSGRAGNGDFGLPQAELDIMNAALLGTDQK